METLYIEGTKTSPTFLLNPQKGLIEISGRSIPENAEKLYLPAIQWVKEYFSEPHQHTVINIKLEYFNSPSARSLINLLAAINDATPSKEKLTVNWFYDETDILDYGQDYQEILGIEFNFIETQY